MVLSRPEPPLLCATDLEAMGRDVRVPFRIALESGADLLFLRPLRVLPGKRVVGEARIDDQPVLAKLFIGPSGERRGAKEASGVKALVTAGIPTPHPVAAERLCAGGYVALTEFLDGSVGLDQVFDPVAETEDVSAAFMCLRPAFSLLGRLHSAGLMQADLHLGNFLVHDEKMLIIDGDAVASFAGGSSGSSRLMLSNLALLIAQLPLFVEDALGDLVKSYAEVQRAFPTDMAALKNEVERARHRRLDHFLAKVGRECTQFSVVHSATRFVVSDRKMKEELGPGFAQLLSDPDEAVRLGRLLKDGGTCTVARAEIGQRALVLKRYNLKNLRHAMSRLWRPSRAWRSWREAHRLLFYGVATPRPIAVIEERLGPLRRRAFLITDYCPGRNLLDCLDPGVPPPSDMAAAISCLFMTLHHLRISHGDLKATNLIWQGGRLWMIDLDAMTQHQTERGFTRAWQRDRARLLRNWPVSSPQQCWLDEVLPPA
ncbi:lipopolysaccharide kinase InaA family protein [Propionivibrio soli]|uniref:lipopolysaccharide kinase InaA family protein n=1 Tax=Propionivibrio soli TaxID=2976531 RepID=UPI0021E97268|nr:lipopolysaccharide kinase InaA family protein [Propionivibrio soli]